MRPRGRPHTPSSRVLAVLGAASLLAAGAAGAAGADPAGARTAAATAASAGPSAAPSATASRSPVAAVATAERRAAVLEAQVALMRESAERYADWQSCLRTLPVSEYGSPDALSGYRYDARDGTGVGYAPALAVDRSSRAGREDYLFFTVRRGGECASAPPLPGGTADAARRRAAARADAGTGAADARSTRPGSRRPAASPRRAAPARTPSLRTRISRLERRVRHLRGAVRTLETAARSFDGWESCVSWIPVTENGDPGGAYGYLYGRDGAAPRYRAALTIDRSDWDDPDYMVLALVGGDRPGRHCDRDPGEGVDR